MLDGLFIDALSRELNGTLRTGRVAAIWMSDATTLIWEVRRGSQQYFLLLSAHPRAARLQLVPEEELPDGRLPATAFVQLLRKHLEGARVQQVVQPGKGRERIIRIELDTRGEGGVAHPMHLVAELIGTRANLLLVDGVTGMVLDSLRPGRAGNPYEPPAPQDKLLLQPGVHDEFVRRLRWLTTSERGQELPVERALVEMLDGVGPLVAREFAGRAGLAGVCCSHLKEEEKERLALVLEEAATACAAGNFRPTLLLAGPLQSSSLSSVRALTRTQPEAVVDFAAVELSSFPETHRLVLDSPSLVLQLFYAPRLVAWRVAERRQYLTRKVKDELARVLRRREKQREEVARAANADEWRKLGELLLSQLHLVPRGATEVELLDYYAVPPRPIRVTLDPALSAQENAALYFSRYSRAKRAQVAAREQLEKSEAEAEYLEGVLAELSWAESEADLDEIEAELKQAGLLPAAAANGRGESGSQRRGHPGKEELPSRNFRRFVTEDGFEILVGRNNRQNEELTFHVARPRDLWFHAQKIPGAHVILRRLGAADAPIPERSILAAARLAAYFSRGAGNARVAVDYTERRFVRKPPGTPPGFVTYTSFKTVDVPPEITDLREAGKSPAC
ncbi:MAG: NFACT family protein [Limnochordales bacterium]|nr:NFACT family protein [Limnochordales bacterium]